MLLFSSACAVDNNQQVHCACKSKRCMDVTSHDTGKQFSRQTGVQSDWSTRHHVGNTVNRKGTDIHMSNASSMHAIGRIKGLQGAVSQGAALVSSRISSTSVIGSSSKPCTNDSGRSLGSCGRYHMLCCSALQARLPHVPVVDAPSCRC